MPAPYSCRNVSNFPRIRLNRSYFIPHNTDTAANPLILITHGLCAPGCILPIIMLMQWSGGCRFALKPFIGIGQGFFRRGEEDFIRIENVVLTDVIQDAGIL